MSDPAEIMETVTIGKDTGPLLRRREVEREVGLSRSSIYDYMSRGAFPRPVNIGPRTVRWLTSEIEDWKRNKIAQTEQ